MRTRATFAIGLVLAMLTPLFAGVFAPLVGASSHREAPLIANDPAADGTDFYMFRSPDDLTSGQNTVTLLANYIPLQPRYGGPNFHHPADEVLYSIKIDNDGDAKADIVYQFRFNSKRVASGIPGVDNKTPGDTYLYNQGPINALDDPNLLFRQYYTVTRIDVDKKWGAQWEASHDGKRNAKMIASGQVMPAFVGRASYCPANTGLGCTEAQAIQNYERLVNTQAIKGTNEGGQVYVGPRQESFYVDLSGVFDLAQFTKQNNTAEFNVTTLALKVPAKLLQNPKNGDPVIGAWTTSSRRATQIIGANNERRYSGPWRQVSRLSSPLVNEVVIGAKDKDKFNASEPKDDVKSFGDYVLNPRLADILNALFGIGAKTSMRGDLVQVFVTGIPPFTRSKTLTVGGEMLRLNTSVPPSAMPNPLGVVGGDLAGFPNGRRPIDDVVDVELTAVGFQQCNGVNEGFGPGIVDAQGKIACTGPFLSDGVGPDGLNFLPTFPYLPTPHSGTEAD